MHVETMGSIVGCLLLLRIKLQPSSIWDEQTRPWLGLGHAPSMAVLPKTEKLELSGHLMSCGVDFGTNNHP